MDQGPICRNTGPEQRGARGIVFTWQTSLHLLRKTVPRFFQLGAQGLPLGGIKIAGLIMNDDAMNEYMHLLTKNAKIRQPAQTIQIV